MATFINDSTLIGSIFAALTDNVTGSEFFTLLIILILVMATMLSLRMPFEYVAIFTLPLMLVYMAFTGEFAAIGGVLIFFLAVIFTRNFFI